MTTIADFATSFNPADWPYGLSCPDCRHTYQAGEFYLEELESFVANVAFVLVGICVDCWTTRTETT